MKKLTFYLLLLFSGQTIKAQVQTVEILLLGAQHEFKDSLLNRQGFEKIQNALAEFGPDIICIESIPIADTLSLQEVRSTQMELAMRLKEEKGIDAIGYTYGWTNWWKSTSNPGPDLVSRSKLANQFYANHDFWNAYYHYFILTKELNDQSLEVDMSALQSSFAMDSMHLRVAEKQRLTEYGNIIFPLADRLGIHHLENIDYRADEKEFLKRSKRAVIGTIFNLKIFRLKRIFKKLESDMLQAEREGKLMDFINSEETQRNYLDLIDHSDRFLKSKNMRRVVALWEKRNRLMAERIVAAIEKTGATKALVTFGAFHVPFVKRYLEKNPGFIVKTYSDVEVKYLITKSSK